MQYVNQLSFLSRPKEDCPHHGDGDGDGDGDENENDTLLYKSKCPFELQFLLH